MSSAWRWDQPAFVPNAVEAVARALGRRDKAQFGSFCPPDSPCHAGNLQVLSAAMVTNIGNCSAWPAHFDASLEARLRSQGFNCGIHPLPRWSSPRCSVRGRFLENQQQYRRQSVWRALGAWGPTPLQKSSGTAYSRRYSVSSSFAGWKSRPISSRSRA